MPNAYITFMVYLHYPGINNEQRMHLSSVILVPGIAASKNHMNMIMDTPCNFHKIVAFYFSLCAKI